MTLALEALCKSFPGIKVLQDVSMTFEPGCVVALLGYNGCGKTTLLRCLATHASAQSGRILMDGEELTRDRLDLRRRLMFLPDFPSRLMNSDPLLNIAIHLKLWKAERPDVEARVAELLKRLGLSKAVRQQGAHSRGQNYKAALTALAAVDPELWLLDEPFASGMDPQGLSAFREEAEAAAHQRGRIIIYSTQIVELACGFADKIAILNSGRLRVLDNERDLNRDPRKLDSLLTTAEA